jgi:hypothetical protein
MENTNNGQYTIFDDEQITRDPGQEPREQGAPDLESLDLESLFNIASKIGIYFPLSGDAITKRGGAYYAKNIGSVETYLTASGLTPETKTAVIRDYLLALGGYYDFQAEPRQMQEALEKLKPNRVFMIDRYGFYRLLLNQYYRFVRTIYDYLTTVKEADTATKQKYIETFPPENLRAAAWAIQRGVIKLLDFEGVPVQIVANFADDARYISELTDYGNFYHLCKYAYLATPEELETIRPPEALKRATDTIEKDPADKGKFGGFFIDEYCKECEQGLSNAAELYTEAMETPNPDLGKWNPKGVKLSANLTTVQQKPLEVHTKFLTDTQPIRKYIAEFPLIAGNEIYKGLVTEYTLQTVIGGLDALRSWGKYDKVSPVNGLLTYHISMEDFAKICGYKDANQNDKTGLFGGLLLLNNLYVYCDRPMKLTRAGKKSKYKIGGWLKIFDLRWFSEDRNDLIIDIYETDLGGELTPITPATLIEMRKGKGKKGLPEKRFTEHILGKDNKKEEDLLKECFGYDDMLKYAEPQDVEDVKTYIRKNKARDRKKIQAWFEKYTETGLIISYTRTQNKAGEWVYRWTRNTAKQIEAPKTNEPKAETVGAEQSNNEQNNNENA